MVAQVENTTYESKTQAIAKELLAAQGEKRSIFAQMRDQMRWDDKLLDWAMSNPGLRVQLFRFIDCLPALRSKAEVARHLQEYMTTEAVELPGALKGILNFTNADSMPGQVAATTVSTAVETLARKYIAGETVQQVLKTVENLRKEKMAFTLDLLGEAVITETEAKAYLQGYIDLIDQLTEAAKRWKTIPEIDEADGEPLPKVQVSVKLTAFYSQFDPLDAEGSKQRVIERIRTLLRHAQEKGAAIHFDMEQYVYKDITFAILKELLLEEEFKTRTDIGVTLQAYLRESEADLKDLIAWAKQRGNPITIRLVKGAYWDQETIKAVQHNWPQPVFDDKVATDANFELLTRLLLENHEFLNAAIGSHNVRSQARAIAIAETLNIPRRRIEYQVLYGMGDRLAKAMVNRGLRVRMYAPYGSLLPGMAYLIRRLLENTANSSFLRQSQENRPIEELIAPPVVKTTASRPQKTTAFKNAADTDFAQVTNRERAQAALNKVRPQLGTTILPYINGEFVQTAESINSVNPSDPTELVAKIGMASVEQAETALNAAKAAFPSWKATPAVERARILRKAADLMEKRRAELSVWVMLEVGKVLQQVDAEVSEAIDFCRYYADEMERLDRGHNYDIAGENNRLTYQPRGIALVISPWNFPIAITTGMTVAALVTGNCVILKPAEVSTAIAAQLMEVLIEAGIPKGIFQFLPAKGSTVGAHLVKHKDVHMIAFTGSQEVGCQIYANAALLQPGQKHMKRVIAEMGGKNAVIVDESCDLDQAVQGVVDSAFGYSGQKCSACSRAIVLEPVYDTFLERFVEATKSLNVGPADHPCTKVGPVVDETSMKRIQHYIATGKQEAKVALEMLAPNVSGAKDGYYVGPTIFQDVPPTATIAQEEIFGPVVAVIKAKTFQEALDIANNTNFALTGGLYSRTPSHIDQAMAEFEVGNLYINRNTTGAIVSRQPFGGFKLSGVGSKAGGPDYLIQFLEPRTITENIQRQGFAPIEGNE